MPMSQQLRELPLKRRGVRFATALRNALMASAAVAALARAQTTALPPALQTIVYRNAPFIMHETRTGTYPLGGVDHMLRVDFDGTTYGPGKASRASDRGAIVDRTATWRRKPALAMARR